MAEDEDKIIDNLIAGIMRTIDDHGWAIIGTMSPEGKPITYTVGLTFLHAPELFIDSMGIMEAHPIIEELAQRTRDGGPYEKDQVTQVNNHTVTLKEYDLSEMFLVKTLFGDNDPVAPTALAVMSQ